MKTNLRLLLILAFLFGNLPIAIVHAQTKTIASVQASLEDNINISELAQKAIIPNRYIVVLSSAAPSLNERNPLRMVNQKIALLKKKYKFQVKAVYEYAIKGFAATMAATVAERMAKDSMVEMIDSDRVLMLNAQTLPAGVNRIGGAGSSTATGNGVDAVAGVDIFILDTGIDTAHADLNVVGGKNFVTTGPVGTPAWADQHGHGTHVAGIAAAKDNGSDVVGAAPGANLYAVRIADANGSGTMSDVTSGVNWVTSVWLKRRPHCPVKEANNPPNNGRLVANLCRPMVANMSVNFVVNPTPYSALDLAVKNSVLSGVFYSIAAGNAVSGVVLSAKYFSPAHTAEAVTVGSYDPLTNIFSSFSAWGWLVDILAPGEGILSTQKGGGTTTMSGTSMSAPHVAGTAALFLSKHGWGANGYPASSNEILAAMKSAAAAPKTAYPNPSITGAPFTGTPTISVYEANF